MAGRRRSGIRLTGCGPVVLVVLVFNLVLGGLLTQYVVEFWASFVKNTPVDIPFWAAALAGLFLGEVALPAAVITLILSFVL